MTFIKIGNTVINTAAIAHVNLAHSKAVDYEKRVDAVRMIMLVAEGSSEEFGGQWLDFTDPKEVKALRRYFSEEVVDLTPMDEGTRENMLADLTPAVDLAF